MSEPTAELVIALLGDPANFERMMTAAEARLDKFLSAVDAKGQQIQASVDRMLGSVSSRAGKLDAALQPVVTALGDVASSASVAGAEVRAAAGDLRAVSGDANAAAKSLASVGTAGRSAGTGVAAGMGQTVGGVSKAQAALSGFAGMVNRVRAAANKPIVQRVIVRQTGSAPGVGGGFRGHAGSQAAESALTQAGSTLAEMGLGLAAPLVAASAAVNDFDKAILDAANNTTMTAADVNALRTNVIALARETNAPLDKITAAFMRAANFGYTGAKGMEVVRAANIAATASGADLEKVTESVAQTMNQFGIPVEDASRVMNLLSYASDSTNQKLDSFVATAGRGFQAAATLHIGLADAAAVMGVLTEKGLSAAQSQTAFRSIVKGIIQPTKQARDEIKALSDKTGIDLVSAFSAAGLAHYGLVRVMDMATKATGGQADALKKVFTDSKNFVPMLTLMSQKHAELTRVMSGSEKAFLDNSRTQEQYQARVKTAAYQLENLKNRAIIAGAAFEEQLAPAMGQVVSLLDRFLDFLQRLTPGEKRMLVDTLAVGAAVSLLGGAVLTLTGRLLGLTRGIWTFVSWLLKIGPAAAAAETAEAGVATAGLAAFGPGAALIVALGVMISLVVRAGDMYLRMRDAINDAADAGKKLAEHQGQMMSQGERQADIVTKNKIGIESGDLNSAIRIAKQIKPRPGENADDMKVIRDASVRNQLAEAGYDTTNAAYNTMAGAAARLKALLADQKTVDTRLRQLNAGGGGERNKAALAVGADGFALAVSRVDPTSIQTTLKESCAEYVSKVFKQAGLNIPVIPGAKALRDKILAMGGQIHSGPALPGDLVVYHGGRMGTKAGGGYHVGVATGDGTDWESSRGKTKHESIAGNLKWSGPGTTVEYITVPGSTFSHLPSGSLPSYVTGSGGPKGTLADFSGDGKPKKSFSGRQYSPLASDFPDLAGYSKVKDDEAAKTTPGNYAEKLADQDNTLAAALAHLENAQLASNGAITESDLALQQQQATLKTYEAQMGIVRSAIQSGTKAVAEDKKTVDASKNAYRQAASAFNSYNALLSREAKAGHKPTEGELTRRSELSGKVKAARAEAEQAERAAVASENMVTEAKRKQLSLQTQIDNTHAKVIHAQQEAAKKAVDVARQQNAEVTAINRETRRLTPKSDFDQRRQDAADNTGDQVQKFGGDADSIAAVLGGGSIAGVKGQAAQLLALSKEYQAELARITADEAKDAQKSADANQKYALESGQETETAYRDYLLTRYRETLDADGQLTEEARAYGAEYLRLTDEMFDEALSRLKEQLDHRLITLKAYAAAVQALEGQYKTPKTKQKGDDAVTAASDAATEKAKENVQKITDKVSGMVMQIVHHAKTIPEVFRDVFQEVLDTVIENFVKQTVGEIVGMVLSSNKALAGLGVGGSSAGGSSAGGASSLLGAASSFVGGAGSGPSLGGLGGIFGVAAKALPMVGALLAGASLLGHLFGPGKHTPTSTQTQQYANVMTSFSPTIDSGFSGSDGLRNLLGNTTRAAAGVPAQGQAAAAGHVFNFNIAAGAFQGVTDPQGHANVLLQHVQTGLAQMTALDNASRGNG